MEEEIGLLKNIKEILLKHHAPEPIGGGDLDAEILYIISRIEELATKEANPLDGTVMVKLADVINFMKDWGITKVDPDGEYEEIELKTVNYLIKAIESKFSA